MHAGMLALSHAAPALVSLALPGCLGVTDMGVLMLAQVGPSGSGNHGPCKQANETFK